MTDSTRAAFEAWESRMGIAESDISDKCSEGAPRAGEYRSLRIQDDWETWQAARKAALEETAANLDSLFYYSASAVVRALADGTTQEGAED